MAIVYFPRLNDAHASVQIAEMLKCEDLDQISKLASYSHPMAYTYSTASSLVSSAVLKLIREEINEIAIACGFPNSRQRDKLRSFDQRVSEALYSQLDLIPSEAANREIWNFLTLVVLPEFAAWRYENTKKSVTFDRWMGDERNTFRKLWWREATLGKELNSRLGEDEAVAIMERPNLSGNPMLARAVAEAFLNTVPNYPELNRSKIMRAGMIYVRKHLPLINFEFFTESELRELTMEMFDASSAARLNLEHESQ